MRALVPSLLWTAQPLHYFLGVLYSSEQLCVQDYRRPAVGGLACGSVAWPITASCRPRVRPMLVRRRWCCHTGLCVWRRQSVCVVCAVRHPPPPSGVPRSSLPRPHHPERSLSSFPRLPLLFSSCRRRLASCHVCLPISRACVTQGTRPVSPCSLPSPLFCYPRAWLSCLGRAAVPASHALLARSASCGTSGCFEFSILRGGRVILTLQPWACVDPTCRQISLLAPRAVLCGSSMLVRASVQARAVRPCSFATPPACCALVVVFVLSSLLLVSYAAPGFPSAPVRCAGSKGRVGDASGANQNCDLGSLFGSVNFV